MLVLKAFIYKVLSIGDDSDTSKVSYDVKKYLDKILPIDNSGLLLPFSLDILYNENNKYEEIIEDFENNTIIELGPGKNPINELFKMKEYKGVDIKHGNSDLNITKIEAYSYLKTLDDNSGIIVSLAMIDKSLYNGNYDEYISLLKEEIIRVSNGKALLLGGGIGEMEKYFGKPKIEILHKVGGYYDFNK